MISDLQLTDEDRRVAEQYARALEFEYRHYRWLRVLAVILAALCLGAGTWQFCAFFRDANRPYLYRSDLAEVVDGLATRKWTAELERSSRNIMEARIQGQTTLLVGMIGAAGTFIFGAFGLGWLAGGGWRRGPRVRLMAKLLRYCAERAPAAAEDASDQ